MKCKETDEQEEDSYGPQERKRWMGIVWRTGRIKVGHDTTGVVQMKKYKERQKGNKLQEQKIAPRVSKGIQFIMLQTIAAAFILVTVQTHTKHTSTRQTNKVARRTLCGLSSGCGRHGIKLHTKQAEAGCFFI